MDERNHIHDFINMTKNLTSELLYIGSRDGFSAKSYHSLTDNKGPILTIVKAINNKSEEARFGCYIARTKDSVTGWEKKSTMFHTCFSSVTSQGDGAMCDPKAFLFSIDQLQKFELVKEQQASVQYC